MKFEKVSYEIIGRFENGTKYGIATKKTVTGYTAAELDGVAVRKDGSGKFWRVDSIVSGLAIIATSCGATRDAAAAYYLENYAERVKALMNDPEKVRKMKEQLDGAPAEEQMASWIKKEYETVSDHRLDKAEKAAKKAGLIVKRINAGDYQHGGKLEIIGDAAAVAEALKSMEEKPESAEPVQEVKAEPVKVQEETPEEVKKSVMDEVKAGDFSAILQMLGTNKSNTAAIIRAGILEKVFTVPEMVTFLETGRAPEYHTFDVWKKAGFTVRKGEKAAFSALIWKHIADGGKDAEPETETDGETEEKAGPDFIHKVSYFFGPAQVEKMEVKKDLEAIPDGCKMEVVKGVKWISGNTKPHKETLKAAGYRWSNKRGAWYRI